MKKKIKVLGNLADCGFYMNHLMISLPKSIREPQLGC